MQCMYGQFNNEASAGSVWVESRHSAPGISVSQIAARRVLKFNVQSSFRRRHTKKQFLDKSGTINQQLQGFQHMYQQHAAGPPVNELYDCPSRASVVYTKHNTVQTLQAENDKLFKENLELKKKIDADKP